MRRLACTSCGQIVRVTEGVWFVERFVDLEWIDPKLFVGGCCLEPSAQLEFGGEREETRAYDPAIADVGF